MTLNLLIFHQHTLSTIQNKDRRAMNEEEKNYSNPEIYDVLFQN